MNLLLLGKSSGKSRDFQRQRVYDFENEVITAGCNMRAISKANIKDVIRHVFAEFGMEHVPWVVSWFEDDGDATCQINRQNGTVHFNFPREHRRIPWVLHEISHCLGSSDHGPRFLAAYFVLLDTYAGFEFDALQEAAEDYKLKVGQKRYVPKRVKRSNIMPTMAA